MQKSQSSVLSVLVNVLFPVLILDYCSDGTINPLERSSHQSLWEIGPLWAMVVALALPISFGIHSLVKQKRFELMSAVGLVGVLLTGLISIFVIGADGHIHEATPWLFAAKEAAIPLFLAAAVLVSAKSESPLLQTFIYNPGIFDIPRIERAVEVENQSEAYRSLLNKCTFTLAGSLVISSIGNFILCMVYMGPVLLLPAHQQQIAYNQAIGSITWRGFVIIGLPLLIALAFVLIYLVKRLGVLTKLPRHEILIGQ